MAVRLDSQQKQEGHDIETASGVHPASFPVCTGSFLPGIIGLLTSG
jgi:hypothetical protein